MNRNRYIIASLAVFAFIFVFDWIFHGNVLTGIYEQTSHLWRPKEEACFLTMMIAQISLAFIFSYIFLKGYESKGIAEGVRYGFLIGLLFVPGYLIFYSVQPFPFELIAYWSIGGIIEMMGAGAVLAAIYQK